MSGVFGAERYACVAREISKVFEEFRRGTLEELINHYKKHPIKGEVVLIVSGKDYHRDNQVNIEFEEEEEEEI